MRPTDAPIAVRPVDGAADLVPMRFGFPPPPGRKGGLLLAAVWRAGDAGEAFSLLTAEPGPDVAPYHTRGVLPLPPCARADWLFGRRPTAELLSPPPAGTLTAVAAPQAGPPNAAFRATSGKLKRIATAGGPIQRPRHRDRTRTWHASHS